MLLAADVFVGQVRVIAQIEGMRPPRMAVFPYGGEAPLPRSEAQRLSEKLIADVEAGLTRLLTAEESSPKSLAQKSEKVVFEGTWDEINDFFYRRCWTDGLPIACPTEEKVEWMLTGTDLPRDRVIAEMPVKGGITTLEKIAVNAVMAGCRPEYMPVLIAAVEAIAEPDYRLRHNQVSTGGCSPFLIINGPMAKELDINAKAQVLGPGWKANSTIGRAIRMIITNCGGIWPGVNDMSCMATPARYTSMVIAENEDALPPGWKPLNVQAGYNRDIDTVTALTMMSITMCGVNGTPEQNIAYIAETMTPIYTPSVWGSAPYVALLGPAFAQNLYEAGFTSKESVSDWLYKHAGRPLRVIQDWHLDLKIIVESGNLPPWVLDASNPDTLIPLLGKPEDYVIIVAGGTGPQALSIQGGHCRKITKVIAHKPASWNKLLEEERKDVGRS